MKKGFTLIELLVVVLIIGVLTAIALPGYRKAVEKSKVAEALNTMSAVANSEHNWYLIHNEYTDDFSDLDIELTDRNGNTADNDSFVSQFHVYELLDAGILSYRNNGEYFIYKDYETGQIMCAPSEHYICENLPGFTKAPCQEAELAWANTNGTCYIDNETRCKDLYGNSMWNEDTENPNNSFCGYNDSPNKILYEGMYCKGFHCNNTEINRGAICEGECHSSKVNDGGICDGKGGLGQCTLLTINSGGICKGDGDHSCHNLTVNSGGICEANDHDTCYNSTYKGSGCCRGKFCPTDVPKCKCPIDEETGMHKTSC